MDFQQTTTATKTKNLRNKPKLYELAFVCYENVELPYAHST